MGLLKGIERFITAHIVKKAVVETPESVRSRLYHYFDLLVVKKTPDPLALYRAISWEYEASELARQRALKPPKTTLRWKLF